MGWLIFVFVIVGIACVLLNLKKFNIATSKNAKVARQEFSYQLHEALFTPSEIAFYRELEQAIGQRDPAVKRRGFL